MSEKPISLRKGKVFDVFMMDEGEDMAAMFEEALESAKKGNDVLIGTRRVVERILFSGAIDDE